MQISKVEYKIEKGLQVKILVSSTHWNVFFIVSQVQLSPFCPHDSPLLRPPPTFQFLSSPLSSLPMGPLYMFLDLTLPLLSPIILLPSPL